jgi:hypothetical protein
MAQVGKQVRQVPLDQLGDRRQGLSRLWVARQYQRRKNVSAAPGYRYSQKVRKRSLRAHARPTFRSSRCKVRNASRWVTLIASGRISYRYLQ